MHIWTHLEAESRARPGLGLYPTAWWNTTGTWASCSRCSTNLGAADNTIVVYTTDNGAEVMTWPDGGTTPFRGEKATNWEGRFPGPVRDQVARHDHAGQVINDLCSHEDFISHARPQRAANPLSSKS
jgi:arylsulfatase